MNGTARASKGIITPLDAQPVEEGMAPRTRCIVEERSVDEVRPLRIVIIGAGISGILACIRLMQRIPNLQLCIYDKNPDIGGTWFENRYPGCACGMYPPPITIWILSHWQRWHTDIPAHTYQASFEPNKEWSTFYAKSPEIHKYWTRVVEKYGCRKYMKLKHRVANAIWDESISKWKLQIEAIDTGSVLNDQCEVVIQATGALNDWKWPQIPGLHDFKGKLMHSASWDESYDYKDQRVAVIGNGSSGIQIVPGILPDVQHIDHYVRSRTWVSPSFARKHIERRGNGLENFTFSQADIELFKRDHESYQKFRKEVELELQSVHGSTIEGTEMQIRAREEFVKNMKRRLIAKPELIDDLIPSFPPACRRLTPGPGYLEALTNDKVDVVTSSIMKIDETGIITTDGQHKPVDVIICATGFDTSYTPRFKVKGREGLTLAEHWNETPKTYLSIATDGFPNYFICLGPNAGLGEGNLLTLIEKEVDYFTECVRKIQRDNIRAMSVRPDAVSRFTQFCDQYFSRTVFSSKCRSWYKGGTEDGRVIALWPGSSLHSMAVFEHPRWEDFEYEYVGDSPMGWLGDGWTENEKYNKINVDYLDDEQIDFPQPIKAV